jgi:hypothetical protein
VALVGETTVGDVPLFGAKGADELFVMGDHDDATLELANGDCETT